MGGDPPEVSPDPPRVVWLRRGESRGRKSTEKWKHLGVGKVTPGF